MYSMNINEREMPMNKNVLVTSDRYLEQFFYAHRISFIRQYYEKGLTHWVYPATLRLLDVLREYLQLSQVEGGAV